MRFILIINILHLCEAESEPTKPPEVIVNTKGGWARHALSSIGFSGIEIHYLLEYHLTRIHMVYRPPNKKEIEHALNWANVSCPSLTQKTTKFEELEESVIAELFGDDIKNVKNEANNLSPPMGKYPELLVDPNFKKAKTLYGLPATPKEVSTGRQNRRGRSYKWNQHPETVTKATMSTTSTTPPWNYNAYEEYDSEEYDSETYDSKPTTKATETTPKPVPKPTTKPLTTTSIYQEPVVDEDFSDKTFNINGEVMTFFGISSLNYEEMVRSASLLLMTAQKDDMFQAVKSYQSMKRDSIKGEYWYSNNQPITGLEVYNWFDEDKGKIYTVTEGIPDKSYTVLNEKNMLEVNAFPKFVNKSRFTRMQVILEYYAKVPAYYWPSKDSSESNEIPLPKQTFTYTQNQRTNFVGGNKLCTRQAIDTSHAFCRVVSAGINFISSSPVNLQILLSRHQNPIILASAAIVWESTKHLALTVETAGDQTDINHRNRRQAAFLAGLAGAATAIGVDMWDRHHSADGEQFKTLYTHLKDLAANVDKAIADEETQTINLRKHQVEIDTREWSMLCTEGLLLKSTVMEYYNQKMLAMTQAAQMLGNQLRTNPMESPLGDQIRELCEGHNPEDKAMCSKHVAKASLVGLKHHGPTIIAEIEVQTPITEKEPRNCKLMEEVTLPRLTYLAERKLAKIEELRIPKRVRIQCEGANFYFASTGAHMLDDKNILLELSDTEATLECDPEFQSCPVDQFTSRTTCHRKIYTTLNNKSFIAISSTDPIISSGFTTIHALGLHGRSREKITNSSLTIKVFPKKPKRNIVIQCGHLAEKEYKLHASSKPDDITILHLDDDIGFNASTTLVDELDKQLKNLKKDQEKAKMKQFGDQWRMKSDLIHLNNTLDEIGRIDTPIGPFSLRNVHLWVALGVIIAIAIIVFISLKIWNRFKQMMQAREMARSSNMRMSTIRRRRNTTT